MNRRHLFKQVGVITLYGSFPAVLSQFISACNSKTQIPRAGFFSDEEFHLVGQLTEALLPKTSTPGALDANVPYFIDLVVKDCMKSEDQQSIRKGLQQMNEQKFLSLPANEKLDAIKKIDEAAFAENGDQPWFRIIKKLGLVGYFTSREGMTKALNYVKVPGDYKACIPYTKGEKALAKTFLMYW
ncbi:MAG TPA: gluconate 2-dehydrogenase subunit 3 family protein [Chitinophagaceae bacterium]|nr:gluconate 2-dehydrogenase subunit 3 family protein [Chitinophagaceae bacterium]